MAENTDPVRLLMYELVEVPQLEETDPGKLAKALAADLQEMIANRNQMLFDLRYLAATAGELMKTINDLGFGGDEESSGGMFSELQIAAKVLTKQKELKKITSRFSSDGPAILKILEKYSLPQIQQLQNNDATA